MIFIFSMAFTYAWGNGIDICQSKPMFTVMADVTFKHQTQAVPFPYRFSANQSWLFKLVPANILSENGLLPSKFTDILTIVRSMVYDEPSNCSTSWAVSTLARLPSPKKVNVTYDKSFINLSHRGDEYKVVLTGLNLMSNDQKKFGSLASVKAITLNYDDYGLSVYFSTEYFVRQLATTYNIVLTGPDSLHYNNYNKDDILLPKLSPGNYQLDIAARNPLTGELSQSLVLAITVLHPPWASPKAKLFLLLFVLAICSAYYYRRRLRRQHLLSIYQTTQASKERMQLALKSSNSGIWDYHIGDDVLYEDRLSGELDYQDLPTPLTLQQHFKLMHVEDYHRLKLVWLDFVAGKIDNLDISYRMRTRQGKWSWYRDVGRIISRDKHNRPNRVSGTYTNITQTKANESKATLFGEAFSQINDWVLILSPKLKPVSANAAFMNVFSLKSRSYLPTLKHFSIALGEARFEEFKQVISKIKPGESWQSEELIETAVKSKHPVLIKITAIVKQGEVMVSNYVIVISDITNQKDAEEKLRHLAYYDYLTNLPNRKLILEKINFNIANHKNNNQKSALFFIDLDKFKQVNDFLGHSVGDDLLRYVSEKLVDNVKGRDLVARQSGDEFMILIDRFHHIEHLSQLAQRIIKCLAEPVKLNGHQVNVSASIGIAIYPDDAETSAKLIQKADLAMMHAKESGRSQFQFFTQDMNEKVQRRITLEGQLQQAWKNDELVNYYQPIVDCQQQNIIGFELLLRWPHSSGMITPGVFIPIAEDMGLISLITERVIDRALFDYCCWQEQYPNSYLSVNLSAVHILQEGLALTLQKLLIKHKLPASIMRLEITEGTLLSDQVIALARLKELKALGFKLLLDDFGTGYSSLTYLSQFPIDVIKIDQSFVRHLQSNPMNKPIIKSIVSLANNLNLACIAEGVETEKQLHYIRSLGCDVIQGYYFAKPLALKEIIIDKFKDELYSLL